MVKPIIDFSHLTVAERIQLAQEPVGAPRRVLGKLQVQSIVSKRIPQQQPFVINCQGKKEFWDRAKYPPGAIGKIEPGTMSYYH